MRCWCSGAARNCAWVSAANNHQLNIPLAGVGIASGTLSNVAQTIAGDKTFSGILKTSVRALPSNGIQVPAFTLNASNEVYVFDPQGAGNVNQTANLPAQGSAADRFYTLIKITLDPNNSNTVTLVPNGSEKIEGGSSFTLYKQYDNVTLYNTGNALTGWLIVNGRSNGSVYPTPAAAAIFDSIGTSTINTSADSVIVPNTHFGSSSKVWPTVTGDYRTRTDYLGEALSYISYVGYFIVYVNHTTLTAPLTFSFGVKY